MSHFEAPDMILPGATLGMLGGGQLGRMFTVAARNMGYRVVVLDPDPDSPAGQLADQHLQSAYHDTVALDAMAQQCAVITTEFENIPADSLQHLALQCPVKPSAAAVSIAQNRVAEKRWLRDNGFATAPFSVIAWAAQIPDACQHTGFPAILKIARFGYDGKGQVVVHSQREVETAFARFNHDICVLEKRVELATEISVVLGRNSNGQTACFPVAENIHHNGILDISLAPARVNTRLQDDARQMALDIAHKLAYCGVLGVEFFVTHDGQLLINEIAPRPHNSGHFTLDACLTNQFELQVRAVCNLPLGATSQHTPAAMVNLLGDLWGDTAPSWQELLRFPQAKLHLYGKEQARAGRKMGHFTCLADTTDAALALASIIRQQIGIHH